MRYCLGNLHDFDPAKDAVPQVELPALDRWARARLAQVTAKVRKAYEDYEFHVVYHAILDFCATDLSAVYFDILKDRLYTAGAKSKARRAAQTVLHEVLFDLLRLLAPVMSFTADEAFGHLPHKPAVSIFLCGLPEPRTSPQDEQVLATFNRLFAVRSEVQKVLEAARREKLIGSSLEAQVLLYAEDAELSAFLKGHAAELAAAFIVSKVELQGTLPAGAAKAESLPLFVKVERAKGEKCPRCWTYSEAVDGGHPVCPKCDEALRS